MFKILPTITTITPGEWRKKVAEIDALGIKEICLFPTCLNLTERKELYRLLEETKLEKAPFAHLRSDMEKRELDYLAERWGTEVFNIHPREKRALQHDLSAYFDRIYVENVYDFGREDDLKNLAGVCVDFSHLEAARLEKPEIYRENLKIIEQYPCGCAHVGAVKPRPLFDPFTKLKRRDLHQLEDLSEMDYLKFYPKKYFPQFIAIELENSLKEQLGVKEYVAKLLAD